MANDICIFCLKATEMTKEHIIPESIGGKIHIMNVCKACNSLLGTEVDAPYCSNLPIALSREQYKLHGKKGHIPCLLEDSTWTIQEGNEGVGTRVRIKEGAPQAIAPISEIQQEKYRSIIHAELPGNMSCLEIERYLRKKVISEYKRLHPDCSEDSPEAQKAFENIIASAFCDAKVVSSHPTLTNTFTINLLDIKREYLKIAYELAFCQYGMEYITKSPTAKVLRDAVINGKINGAQIHGCIPCTFPSSCSDFYPDAQYELIFCVKYIAIKLFGIWGVVEVLSNTENYTHTGSLQTILSNDGCLEQLPSRLLCWHKHISHADDNSPEKSDIG